jgi:hypothetical protein
MPGRRYKNGTNATFKFGLTDAVAGLLCYLYEFSTTDCAAIHITTTFLQLVMHHLITWLVHHPQHLGTAAPKETNNQRHSHDDVDQVLLNFHITKHCDLAADRNAKIVSGRGG